ncbi:putative inorganic phosphate cotransporter [Bradysia coprophila]|uniref:putative inorganic phosphate cotransporter n=1 Tax=Bradysia coprophila TaxID=38358 RepID=UPI00187D83CD|nr:putative inorganic phosphate cotransporter [Bradysia coprophila]
MNRSEYALQINCKLWRRMDPLKWRPSMTLFHKMRNSALFSQRSLLTLMALTGLVNVYLMRLCLNLLMLKMISVNSRNRGSEHDKLLRAYPNFYQHTRSTMMDGTQIVEFSAFRSFRSTTTSVEWSEETGSLIKSAFFIGYALLYIPAAFLGQKYGGKTIFNLGLFFTALCTLVTPIVAQYGGADGLITLRFVMGIVETHAYPALIYLLSCWIPKNERGRVSSIVFCGGQVQYTRTFYLHGQGQSGTLIGSTIVNVLTGFERDGCHISIFYTFGILGILWNIAFYFLVFNTPTTHPRISVEEKTYLQNEIGDLVETKTFCQIPWVSMIISPAVLVLIIAQIAHDWGFYILASELPNYLKIVLKFNNSDLVWSTSIAFMVGYLFSVLCGIVCDFIVSKEFVTRTRARKIFGVNGSIISAGFTLLIYHVKCDRVAALACYILAMCFMDAFYTGAQANFLDLCPNYSGALMGLVNGAGAICGFAAPYLTRLLTTDGKYEQWGSVFWTLFVLALISFHTYVKWASGEVQPWNDDIDDAERAKPMKEAMQRLFKRKVGFKRNNQPIEL